MCRFKFHIVISWVCCYNSFFFLHVHVCAAKFCFNKLLDKLFIFIFFFFSKPCRVGFIRSVEFLRMRGKKKALKGGRISPLPRNNQCHFCWKITNGSSASTSSLIPSFFFFHFTSSLSCAMPQFNVVLYTQGVCVCVYLSQQRELEHIYRHQNYCPRGAQGASCFKILWMILLCAWCCQKTCWLTNRHTCARGCHFSDSSLAQCSL